MELDKKQEHVLRCIKLGMDLYSSYIVAQCTQEEIDILDEDEEFIARIEFEQKLQEQDLLKQHSEAALLAGMKGNTHGFEWMLGKINPGRWGQKQDLNVNSKIEVIPAAKPDDIDNGDPGES